MPYAYETLTAAVADLAGALYDPTNQFWTFAELATYIQEALQTWNALTSFWRASQTFTLSANNNNLWYDLTTVGGSIRPMTTTDNNLFQIIEYHLLEPQTATYPLTWTGSNQYNVSDLISDVGQRVNDVLGVTGCTLTRTLVAAATNNTSTAVADNTIDFRHIAWIPTSNNAFAPVGLFQSDDRVLQDYNPLYLSANAAVPTSWRITAQVPLTFSVDSLPPTTGNYETLSINAIPNLSNTANTVLNIPNDWCWVPKFGAMRDLFAKSALAEDQLRLDYCERRYLEGMSLLYDAQALLSATIGNNALQIDGLRNADDFNPGWMNAPFGNPVSIYTAGLNLLAFYPPANTNATVVAQVIENAPLPANNNDQIQLGRDDLAVVLDYAQHLAAIKMGGAEFQATIPLYIGFLKRAALYNSKLKALGEREQAMYESSLLQQERDPVYSLGQTPREMMGGNNG